MAGMLFLPRLETGYQSGQKSAIHEAKKPKLGFLALEVWNNAWTLDSQNSKQLEDAQFKSIKGYDVNFGPVPGATGISINQDDAMCYVCDAVKRNGTDA
ncbi:MAG: hypothetical protein AB8B62_02455 [Roseobacter sp.]